MASNKNLKVSIVIRAYNAEKTIERAVESALNQEFSKSHYEIIVINDGSTDKTKEIISKYEKNENVKIVNQKNLGAYGAGEVGLHLSCGKYVTLLDGDDEFEPILLKELVSVLEKNPPIDFAYSDYYEIKEGKKELVSPKNIFETIAGGIVFNREKFKAEGFYRKGIFWGEYDLLLRTLDKWKSYYCKKPLFTYHRRKESISGNALNVEKGIEELKSLHPTKTDYINLIRRY